MPLGERGRVCEGLTPARESALPSVEISINKNV